MQARLSTDILARAERSKFVRTMRGRFTLRSKLSSSDTSSRHVVGAQTTDTIEYVAERRVLRTPKEEVLCVGDSYFGDVLTFQGIDTDPRPILARLLRDESTSYIPRSEAEERNDAKQFITYVLVQCGQRLLFFRRSYLSRAAEFLRGSRCIGLGGHVSAADADMLSIDDKGLSACARRELTEELRLPHPVDHSRANTPRAQLKGRTREAIRLFQNAPLELLGVLNDDSSEVGRRHLAVIYRAWLSNWDQVRRLQKGESSIKGVGWIDLTKDRVDISEFEYWSQLCLRKFYPSTPFARSGFRLLNLAKLASDSVLVVTGRIGSGKTETASYLSQKLSWPLINSGRLLEELMTAPPIAEIGRREFQMRALDFIRTDGGPAKLAAFVAQKAKESGQARCIVDGIRHLTTFEELTGKFGGRVSLVFVQTPPDVAYEMYRAREEAGSLSFTYRRFLEIYDAPVESEIPSLGRRAQIYIYNSFGIDAFRRTLEEVASAVTGGARKTHMARERGKARARTQDDAA